MVIRKIAVLGCRMLAAFRDIGLRSPRFKFEPGRCIATGIVER